MNKVPLFIVVGSLAALSGCVINVGGHEDSEDWLTEQRANQRAIQGLEIGMDRARVESRMGSPDFNEAFVRGGEEYRVLWYRTHRVDDDGRTTKDETTPLVFVDGQLVGWGDSAVDHATGPASMADGESYD